MMPDGPDGPGAPVQDDEARIPVGGLRTLGEVAERADERTVRPEAPPEMRAIALETLRGEFDRVIDMQRKVRAEAKIGADEKGRDAQRPQEKLRSLVASLEGMNRFALAMGLVTPADSRQLYAAAMDQGLYEGWS